MREILFRGRLDGHKEWFEGFYMQDVEEDDYLDKVNHVHTIRIPYGDHYADYKVDSKTVGQYSGLCDKARNLIFEGDVLSVKWLVLVYTDKDTGAFMVRFANYPKANKPRTLYSYLQQRDKAGTSDRDCLVIGNIHDNPEMLEINNWSTKLDTMIRFIEMTGIDLDNVKSFGFWDTVTERLVPLGGGEYRFKSYKGFMLATKGLTGSNKARLDALIPNKWRNPEQCDKMRYFAFPYEAQDESGKRIAHGMATHQSKNMPSIKEMSEENISCLKKKSVDAYMIIIKQVPTELTKEDYLSFIKD